MGKPRRPIPPGEKERRRHLRALLRKARDAGDMAAVSSYKEQLLRMEAHRIYRFSPDRSPEKDGGARISDGPGPVRPTI